MKDERHLTKAYINSPINFCKQRRIEVNYSTQHFVIDEMQYAGILREV